MVISALFSFLLFLISIPYVISISSFPGMPIIKLKVILFLFSLFIIYRVMQHCGDIYFQFASFKNANNPLLGTTRTLPPQSRPLRKAPTPPHSAPDIAMCWLSQSEGGSMRHWKFIGRYGSEITWIDRIPFR